MALKGFRGRVKVRLSFDSSTDCETGDSGISVIASVPSRSPAEFDFITSNGGVSHIITSFHHLVIAFLG